MSPEQGNIHANKTFIDFLSTKCPDLLKNNTAFNWTDNSHHLSFSLSTRADGELISSIKVMNTETNLEEIIFLNPTETILISTTIGYGGFAGLYDFMQHVDPQLDHTKVLKMRENLNIKFTNKKLNPILYQLNSENKGYYLANLTETEAQSKWIQFVGSVMYDEHDIYQKKVSFLKDTLTNTSPYDLRYPDLHRQLQQLETNGSPLERYCNSEFTLAYMKKNYLEKYFIGHSYLHVIDNETQQDCLHSLTQREANVYEFLQDAGYYTNRSIMQTYIPDKTIVKATTAINGIVKKKLGKNFLETTQLGNEYVLNIVGDDIHNKIYEKVHRTISEIIHNPEVQDCYYQINLEGYSIICLDEELKEEYGLIGRYLYRIESTSQGEQIEPLFINEQEERLLREVLLNKGHLPESFFTTDKNAKYNIKLLEDLNGRYRKYFGKNLLRSIIKEGVVCIDLPEDQIQERLHAARIDVLKKVDPSMVSVQQIGDTIMYVVDHMKHKISTKSFILVEKDGDYCFSNNLDQQSAAVLSMIFDAKGVVSRKQIIDYLVKNNYTANQENVNNIVREINEKLNTFSPNFLFRIEGESVGINAKTDEEIDSGLRRYKIEALKEVLINREQECRSLIVDGKRMYYLPYALAKKYGLSAAHFYTEYTYPNSDETVILPVRIPGAQQEGILEYMFSQQGKFNSKYFTDQGMSLSEVPSYVKELSDRIDKATFSTVFIVRDSRHNYILEYGKRVGVKGINAEFALRLHNRKLNIRFYKQGKVIEEDISLTENELHALLDTSSDSSLLIGLNHHLEHIGQYYEVDAPQVNNTTDTPATFSFQYSDVIPGEVNHKDIEEDILDNLTRWEQVKLIREYRNNNNLKARSILINSNRNYVSKIANNYRGSHFFQEDLIQEGMTGLIHAIDTFDPEKGTTIISYATAWIHKKIRRALFDKDRTVRYPNHVEEDLSKLRKQLEEIEKMGISSEKDILHELRRLLPEFTVSKISQLYALLRQGFTASLDEMLGSEDEISGSYNKISRENLIADETALNPEETALNSYLQDKIRTAINNLSEREQYIISMRYGFNNENRKHTMQEIGAVLGITRARVDQIEKAAIKKLSLDQNITNLADWDEE